MYLRKVLEDCSWYANSRARVFLKTTVPLFSFSIIYAAFEYYLITDPSYGLRPILFSLIYPYHLLMAGLFGIAAYSFVALCFPNNRNRLLTLIIVSAVFSVMLVIEDFAWFALRAIAPRSEDNNGGKLVTEGEWTTQFMGSTNFYFTSIPNWYFLSAFYATITSLTVRSVRKKEYLRFHMNIR